MKLVKWAKNKSLKNHKVKAIRFLEKIYANNKELFAYWKVMLEKYTFIVYYFVMKSDIYDVKLTSKANRGLKKIPIHIVLKLRGWIESVGAQGLREVRKIPGFHDEPLKGQLKGLRSIRLNNA